MKQFAIIGMGNFGRYLAVHLYDKGHEGLVVDRKPAPIQEIKDRVSQAVVADATDILALKDLGLEDMDAVVVSIGTGLSESILATLNLIDIGVKRLLAMAISDSHGRILQKIGAKEVFFPEMDQALLIGERLHNPHLLDYLPLIEGYTIIQISPPQKFVGKTLKELNLINEYGVQVIAVKELVPDRLNVIPTGDFLIKESDLLIVLGPDEALERLREEASG